jgi:hypothetical protein
MDGEVPQSLGTVECIQNGLIVVDLDNFGQEFYGIYSVGKENAGPTRCVTYEPVLAATLSAEKARDPHVGVRTGTVWGLFDRFDSQVAAEKALERMVQVGREARGLTVEGEGELLSLEE